MLRARPPIIIDIEASGFGAESYPSKSAWRSTAAGNSAR
jgi:hypothetical protein